MIKSLLFVFFIFITFIKTNAVAGENSHYDFSWLDPDKEIFVLQNRTYQKDGHAYINIGGGFTASGAFVDSLNMQNVLDIFLLKS